MYVGLRSTGSTCPGTPKGPLCVPVVGLRSGLARVVAAEAAIVSVGKEHRPKLPSTPLFPCSLTPKPLCTSNLVNMLY
jgi:hypothetical protein